MPHLLDLPITPPLKFNDSCPMTTLASDELHAGYDSDKEVYVAVKVVDAGMLEYDSDDNPIVLDKKKIKPIAALDHSSIDYEPFNKDFYVEKESISGFEHEDKGDFANLQVASGEGLQVFTFKQLHSATGGFSKSNVFGKGGFGLVYHKAETPTYPMFVILGLEEKNIISLLTID